MKKYKVHISHIEYSTVEVLSENAAEAEEMALKNIEDACWGNDETEVLDVEELINTKRIEKQ